jgi:hypothetical protein
MLGLDQGDASTGPVVASDSLNRKDDEQIVANSTEGCNASAT